MFRALRSSCITAYDVGLYRTIRRLIHLSAFSKLIHDPSPQFMLYVRRIIESLASDRDVSTGMLVASCTCTYEVRKTCEVRLPDERNNPVWRSTAPASTVSGSGQTLEMSQRQPVTVLRAFRTRLVRAPPKGSHGHDRLTAIEQIGGGPLGSSLWPL